MLTQSYLCTDGRESIGIWAAESHGILYVLLKCLIYCWARSPQIPAIFRRLSKCRKYDFSNLTRVKCSDDKSAVEVPTRHYHLLRSELPRSARICFGGPVEREKVERRILSIYCYRERAPTSNCAST